MRYCIICGVKIPAAAKFCQDCGKEQPEAIRSDVAAAPADELEEPAGSRFLASPKGKIMLGVSVFIVMIAVFTGTMILVNAK